jgi:hypothetical protein
MTSVRVITASPSEGIGAMLREITSELRYPRRKSLRILRIALSVCASLAYIFGIVALSVRFKTGNWIFLFVPLSQPVQMFVSHVFERLVPSSRP